MIFGASLICCCPGTSSRFAGLEAMGKIKAGTPLRTIAAIIWPKEQQPIRAAHCFLTREDFEKSMLLAI